jgi:hypothetical protein
MAGSWQVVYDRASCPRCAAPTGQPCRRPDGVAAASVPHVARSRVAAGSARPVELPWFNQGHPTLRTCLVCGRDCSSVALAEVVYTFERCSCFRVSYVHLVEQLWHRTCLTGRAQAGTG